MQEDIKQWLKGLVLNGKFPLKYKATTSEDKAMLLRLFKENTRQEVANYMKELKKEQERYIKMRKSLNVALKDLFP